MRRLLRSRARTRRAPAASVIARLVPLALAALSALALLPASASAGSVSTASVEAGIDSKGVSYYRTVVTWAADPGEANRLEVRHDAASALVVLRDAGAPLRAGNGCEARPDGTAVCAAASDSTVSLTGGDGDDELRLDDLAGTLNGGDGDDLLTATADALVTLEGGAGDDALTGGGYYSLIDGGAGSDVIQGGAGTDRIVDDPPRGPYAADRIDGGPGGSSLCGPDTLTYAGRSTPVTVDLLAGNGGAPGEGDVISGIEGVEGGEAADVLRGTEAKDVLGSGGGADLIDGRGGDDKIYGGSDPGARLHGGDGDDFVHASGGTVDCGRGADRVRDPAFALVVATASCEQVYADGAFSARLLPVRGRVLELRLRGSFFEFDQCGAFVALRRASGGGVLARRFLRMREGQPRALRLTAARPLPARVRLDVRGAFCRDESRRPFRRSSDPYAEAPGRLRFTAVLR